MIIFSTMVSLRRNEENKAVCSICLKWLQRFGKDGEISQDDRCSQNALSNACRQLLSPQSYKLMMQEVNGEKQRVGSFTAWRVEGTLREFPKFPTVNLWFKYPVHCADETGCLKDIEPDGEKPPWKKAMEKRKPKEKKSEIRKAALETAFEACKIGGEVALKDLAEYMGVTEKTIRNHVNEHPRFNVSGSLVEKNGKKKTTSLREVKREIFPKSMGKEVVRKLPHDELLPLTLTKAFLNLMHFNILKE